MFAKYYFHQGENFTMSRKEIKKKAKQYLKGHYWLFVAACLLAAWVGSDFSNVLSPMKLYSTKNIEKTASTSYSSSMLIEGQTANASDAIYEALHGNAEEGRRISDTITADEIQRSETSNHPALGRSRGVFASLLNGIKSGGIVVSVISALDHWRIYQALLLSSCTIYCCGKSGYPSHRSNYPFQKYDEGT